MSTSEINLIPSSSPSALPYRYRTVNLPQLVIRQLQLQVLPLCHPFKRNSRKIKTLPSGNRFVLLETRFVRSETRLVREEPRFFRVETRFLRA